MRRRARLVDAADAPAWVAKFDPADWWVDDLEDELEVQYARIRWHVARRAWRNGEDVRPYLGPPPWISRNPQGPA